MALPIWALFMKRNYADPELNISKEEFERPEELSINVDCTQEREETEGEIKNNTPNTEEEIDF